MTWSRVLVGHELVLATNSHVSLASFKVSLAERLDVTIVLTWSRSIFTGHLITRLFFDDGSVAARLHSTYGSLGLILTGSRILIRHKFVLVTKVNFIHAAAHGSQVSIILTRIGRVFAGDLISRLFLDNGCV